MLERQEHSCLCQYICPAAMFVVSGTQLMQCMHVLWTFTSYIRLAYVDVT